MGLGKGLGRGFESLIPTELVDEEFDLTAKEDEKVSELKNLPIEKIVRDEEQPRKNFDEEALFALSSSIKEHGVLQPIVVTRDGDKYKIVAGERRWRASKIAGLKEIPAIVRTIDAQNRLELSVIENAQREDLNAIELATAYAKLKNQFNLDTKEIAKKIGKSESMVVNVLRLLNLPEEMKKAMVEHNLSEGVMRPIVAAEPEVAERALKGIIEDGWTARKVELYVAASKKKSSAAVIKASMYMREEEKLAKKYNAKAKIRGRSLTLTFKNGEELKKVLAILGKD